MKVFEQDGQKFVKNDRGDVMPVFEGCKYIDPEAQENVLNYSHSYIDEDGNFIDVSGKGKDAVKIGRRENPPPFRKIDHSKLGRGNQSVPTRPDEADEFYYGDSDD